jgi:hypothetical protein
MQIYARPWCWGSVGLRAVPSYRMRMQLSYPLKTSLVSGQWFGSLLFSDNASFQVAFNLVAVGAGGGICEA